MKLSEIGRITDLSRPLKVGVAGADKLEFVATKNAISRLGLLAAVSLISIPDTERPVGAMQIARGAGIKANLASKSDSEQDIYLGIENGIDQGEDGNLQYIAMIVAIFGDEKNKVLGCAQRCVFPTDDVFSTQELSGDFNENTGKYTAGNISRRELLENEILEVLYQIFPKMR